VDRYSDIFIITGIFAGGYASWQIGVFALTGALMVSIVMKKTSLSLIPFAIFKITENIFLQMVVKEIQQ
jgi:hypothetical protein